MMRVITTYFLALGSIFFAVKNNPIYLIFLIGTVLNYLVVIACAYWRHNLMERDYVG